MCYSAPIPEATPNDCTYVISWICFVTSTICGNMTILSTTLSINWGFSRTSITVFVVYIILLYEGI